MAIFKPVSGTGSLESAHNLRVITPSDTLDLPDGPCRAVWIGDTGGILSVIAVDDTAAVSIPVAANSQVNVSARRVTTASTATTLIAMY